MAKKLLGAAPSNPEDAATKAYADSKFKPYASTSDLDSETLTVAGFVSPATNWGDYTGITAYNAYSGVALVETIAGFRSGGNELTQTLTIGKHTSSYLARAQRTKTGASAWTAWTQSIGVPTPVSSSDPASKSYVDGRALASVNPWSGLDSLTSTVIGKVYPDGDLGTLTGLTELDNNPGEADILFEHHNTYVDDVDFFQSQVQRVWVPLADQGLLTIRRSRTNAPAYTWSAWSAWTIETSGGGGSGVVETIVAGTGISVDDTDPANPIVSATGGGGGGATMIGKAAWWTSLPTSATWVIPGEPGSVSGTINFTTGGGAIWLRPLDIGAPSTLTAIGVNVGTGSAVGTGHFGVWESGADGLPTGLPVWTSAFDITTAGNKIITVSPALDIDASTRLWIGVLILSATAGTFRRHLSTPAHGGDSFEHHGTDANAALGASGNAIRFPLSHTTTATDISTDLTGATRTAQGGMPLVAVNVTRT